LAENIGEGKFRSIGEGGDRALQGQAQTGGVMTMSNVVVLREPVAPKRQAGAFSGRGQPTAQPRRIKALQGTEPAQRDASLRREANGEVREARWASAWRQSNHAGRV
jgi:hypothetical protein